jgi:hypothetical protein
LERYIIILLTTRKDIETNTNISVRKNIAESPNLNHAVSENGIYIFRKTTANNTEKVTVPIS